MENLKVSWESVVDATLNISRQIRLRQLEFDMILAITRGGLIPAGILSYQLEIKDIRTVSLELYKEKDQQDINVIQEPNFYMFIGKNVLVVDDVIQSGKTYAYLRKRLKPVMDIITFQLAVLFHKGIAPDPQFYGAKTQINVWLKMPWD